MYDPLTCECREAAASAETQAREDYANARTQQEAEAAEAAIKAAVAARAAAQAETEPPQPVEQVFDEDQLPMYFQVGGGPSAPACAVRTCCSRGRLQAAAAHLQRSCAFLGRVAKRATGQVQPDNAAVCRHAPVGLLRRASMTRSMCLAGSRGGKFQQQARPMRRIPTSCWQSTASWSRRTCS